MEARDAATSATFIAKQKKSACFADVKRLSGHDPMSHFLWSGSRVALDTNFLCARSSHFTIVTEERRISHVIEANWCFFVFVFFSVCVRAVGRSKFQWRWWRCNFRRGERTRYKK